MQRPCCERGCWQRRFRGRDNSHDEGQIDEARFYRMMDLDDDKIEQTVQRQQGSRKGGSSFIMDFNREVDRWVVMVHVMDAKSRLQQAPHRL